MCSQANSTIHSSEQINLNSLKYFGYSYVTKSNRRINLTSKGFSGYKTESKTFIIFPNECLG